MQNSFLRIFTMLMLALVLVPRPVRAEGAEVSATIDTENPTAGERIKYRIQVEGGSGGKLTPPPLSSLENLTFEGGPSTMTEQSIINGVVRFSQSWTYTLSAARAGEFKIPAASYLLDGVTYSSNVVTGTIAEASESTVLSAKTDYSEVNAQLDGRYFLMADYPKEVWSRQIFSVDSYIYRDVDLPEPTGIGIDDPSPGQDFVFIRNNSASENNVGLRWENIDYQGKKFQRALVSRAWYVPTKSGSTVLNNVTVYVRLPTKNRRGSGFEDDFLFMRPQAIQATLRTRPLEMAVKVLPPPPSDAALAIVGDVKVTSSLDRMKVPQLDPVTLKLTIEGEANFAGLDAPKVPEIQGLQLIDTPATEKSWERSAALNTRKDYELIFQAKDSGKLVIPPITIASFDTSRGAWTSKKTTAYELQVMPTATTSVELVSASANTNDPSVTTQTNKATAKRVGEDVAWIDRTPLSNSDNRQFNESILTKPWFWGAHAIAPVLALIAGFVAMRRRNVDSTSAAFRAREWRRQSEQALKEARSKLAVPDKNDFYASVSRGAMAFAAAALGRSPQGLTLDEAAEGLRRAGKLETAIARLREIVSRAEAVRFSPAPDTPERRKKDLDEAEAVLAELSSGGGAA
jgi:hypothetical protein